MIVVSLQSQSLWVHFFILKNFMLINTEVWISDLKIFLIFGLDDFEYKKQYISFIIHPKGSPGP